jgi:hypothetical protein
LDKINRELSGLAQKLSSLRPWEPVQTLLRRKRLLQFSFETIFPDSKISEKSGEESVSAGK